MTADEIRDDQRWTANNREHLGDRAERISRALDIAREMVERSGDRLDFVGRSCRWGRRGLRCSSALLSRS
jgi:hypothetical protein